MVAFLPQFIDPLAGPVWLQFAVLGGILIDAATGSVFIGLGVTLAAER